jgi:hypothetical protein
MGIKMSWDIYLSRTPLRMLKICSAKRHSITLQNEASKYCAVVRVDEGTDVNMRDKENNILLESAKMPHGMNIRGKSRQEEENRPAEYDDMIGL